MEKIKVLWMCSISNPLIRSNIKIRTSKLEPFMMKVVHRKFEEQIDCGIWNTNAIEEVKSFPQIELHVLCVTRDLLDKRYDFESEGIYYHVIRDENSSLFKKVIRYLFTRYSASFKTNRKQIKNVVEEIKPDLIHVIGAENPQYSLALLDVPNSIPTFLQLQALLVSIADKTVGAKRKDYEYKGEIEKELIKRADFVGTSVPSFIDYIHTRIDPNVKIINTTLAMAQKINTSECSKQFDFVHFAANLDESKATDIAIEAFGIAHEKFPDITLNVVGGISAEFKGKITQRINELGLSSSIVFEGKLPTHDDVISQIRKSKIALLPLKVSIVPNTIREAMANGLPVITTVTPGTPSLNEKRQSVLISPQDDIQDIANNMSMLLEKPDLCEQLKENSALTEYERENNKDIIKHWVEVYESIIINRLTGKQIPNQWLL